MLLNATDVPGWITAADLAILSIIASHTPKNSSFVEIGSWVGRSSTAIHSKLDSSVQLHAVDIWSTEYFPPNKFELTNTDHMAATNYQSVDSKVYKNYRTAIDIAVSENSWQPAFAHLTAGRNIVQHCCTSAEFEIPKNWSAAFIDGDHSTEQLELDILKFLKSDELDCKLICGDDFNMDHADSVPQALLNALTLHGLPGKRKMWTKRRFIVRFPRSNLWFMWPVAGYWYDKLPTIFNEVTAQVGDHIQTIRYRRNDKERGENPAAYQTQSKSE